MREEESFCEGKSLNLLKRLEHILESDPFIDEVGFIHPTQFVSLNEEAGGPSISPVGTLLQSDHDILKLEKPEANYSDEFFWNKDCKLGISTQILLPLYNAAKHAFLTALGQYKMHISLSAKKDESNQENISTCWFFLNILESEVMKHSKALLLLSSDFGTAWNSRKLILSKKQHFPHFMDELFLSALVLSYSPKSECAWSHRRWVIKVIAGKCSNLHEIVEKESELVKKIAEKSKMNYRAWNHRCWLISYMQGGQVRREFDKSRDWARLHVSDNSCFHYRALLMHRLFENSWHKQDVNTCSKCNTELYLVWKEELDWDEKLIKLYKGREALWLHRRFLLLYWIKHLGVDHDVSCHSEHKTIVGHEINILMNTELELLHFCSTIRENDFEDFQSQLMFSANYFLWLTKQISKSFGIEIQKKLQAEELIALLKRMCPEKIYLLDTWRELCESI